MSSSFEGSEGAKPHNFFKLFLFSSHLNRRLTTALQLHTLHVLNYRSRRHLQGSTAHGSNKRMHSGAKRPTETEGHAGKTSKRAKYLKHIEPSAAAAIEAAEDAIVEADRHERVLRQHAPAHLHKLLLRAAKHGDISQVQDALAAGAGVNHQDEAGHTALHFASSYGHEQVVSLLLRQGADSYLYPTSGSSPLIAACKHGHSAVVRALLVQGAADAFHLNGEGRNALMEAAAAGHAGCIQELLEYGDADANTEQEQTGSHPLLEAAAGGHVECLVLLLAAGSKVNRVDKAGTSALLAASRAGHLRCVQLLLEHQAKHIADFSRKRTPLMAAAAGGHCGVVAVLLKAGADATAVDTEAMTALELAANVRCKVLLEDYNRGKLSLSPRGIKPRTAAAAAHHQQQRLPWLQEQLTLPAVAVM